MRLAATRILGRFADPGTRAAREDLVQEVCLLLWQWQQRVGAVRRLDAATRTICYRRRRRALADGRRGAWLHYVAFGGVEDGDGVAEPGAPELDEPTLCIAGRRVPLGWATRRLPDALKRLSRFDQRLLLAYHEGFCCAELAARFDRSEDCIKTRIHRARRRVQRAFESLIRRSEGFDEPWREEER